MTYGHAFLESEFRIKNRSELREAIEREQEDRGSTLAIAIGWLLPIDESLEPQDVLKRLLGSNADRARGRMVLSESGSVVPADDGDYFLYTRTGVHGGTDTQTGSDLAGIRGIEITDGPAQIYPAAERLDPLNEPWNSYLFEDVVLHGGGIWKTTISPMECHGIAPVTFDLSRLRELHLSLPKGMRPE